MVAHAQFVDGPLAGITFSSDSAIPEYATLANLIYSCSKSFSEGTRIRWHPEAIRSARENDFLGMLPLFSGYVVLKSTCKQEDVNAWFHHIPV
jgi:hypothetical protein